ncbi:GTPase Era [Zhongshania aliphaticivorans]|uniref:GTPase Era n=1 Tax=Zhongshania aliphaticivorans TaxID=1470434 RepID=A0A5S9NB15_9GAMM|nr:GTPase Era [Zhongshania aliphaticivorans]CAA0087352.1 GTPase Era [Zhongshania aliphaticivorans]CAA0114617.1 GTPase Era [Zhongshania aliphaticivorans]
MNNDESLVVGKQRCGFVAIVGRPNVGKSTLLNHILGQKLSITSRKPQTTRHQVLGIKTEGESQVIYVDTPGLHLKEEKALNRYMNRAASSAIKDVDLVLFVVDRDRWTDDDELVLRNLKNAQCPIVLVINKVDRLEDKGKILPLIESLQARHGFDDVVPVSALRGHNREELETVISHFLPENEHMYPEDQITDRSERFLASELVREKIMRQLGEEIPYSMTVEIEEFKASSRLLEISALILVERDGQKKIIIGEGGSRLRQIGTEARKDMEIAFDNKVMLRLWVKVKSGWADDERALRSLGYNDFK